MKYDFIDLSNDFITQVKDAVELYEKFNENRPDGLNYHTDCLDDFIDFLEEGLPKNNEKHIFYRR